VAAEALRQDAPATRPVVHSAAASATQPTTQPVARSIIPASTRPTTQIGVQVITLAATRPTTQPATRPASASAATQPTTRLAAASTRPTTRPVFPDPDVTLAQFSSPDWRVRRQAQERLVAIGEEAKPFIHELIRRAPNDQTRKNAEAVLKQIDDNRIMGPSFITLHVKDAAPADVVAEISRQCFAPLLTSPDNLWQQGTFPKVTLDVDHKPFWAVFPDLCQKLGVDLRPSGAGMRLMQAGGMQIQGVSQIDGPFLVVANQITYSRTRNFGQGQGEQTSFGMSLTVYAEPKLIVLRSSGTINLDKAIDDHGNSLVPEAGAQRMFFGGFNGMGGFNVYSPLKYPTKNPGRRITSFKGSTTLVLQTGVEKLDIPDLMHVKELPRLVNGMQVTFIDMKKNNDAWQLRLRIPQPNFGGQEWQQLMDGVQNRLQVLDANGASLDHRGMSTSGNNNSIDLTLEFARSTQPDGRNSGDPARLVWEVPTSSKEVSVPIDLKDLPLFDDK
jgi:hypothetical protein